MLMNLTNTDLDTLQQLLLSDDESDFIPEIELPLSGSVTETPNSSTDNDLNKTIDASSLYNMSPLRNDTYRTTDELDDEIFSLMCSDVSSIDNSVEYRNRDDEDKSLVSTSSNLCSRKQACSPRSSVESQEDSSHTFTNVNHRKYDSGRSRARGITAKEKNRLRESNRRNALKSCISACAMHLPQRHDRALLKKEILQGCAALLADIEEVRLLSEKSKKETSLALKRKHCINDQCLYILTNL